MKPQSNDHAERRLSEFIARNSDSLSHNLRLYALRAGLATSLTAEQVAQELLSDVVAEALQHADRFDTSRHAMSWLLGIGANLIKRRIADRAKREKREPLVRDMYDHIEDRMSEGELFERVASVTEHNESQLESEQAVEALLGELSLEDRQVIQLAIIHDMDGALLAKALGVKPGTARMRLHRALRRLRLLHNVGRAQE